MPPRTGTGQQQQQKSGKEWWPPTDTRSGALLTPTPLHRDANQLSASRLSTGRSQRKEELFSSNRSTPSHIRLARKQQEEQLHKEVGRVFQQVEKDVGFNMEDLYHGHEAERILEDQEAEARGVIAEHARILHDDVVQSGLKFKHKKEEEEDAQGIWRQNRNPGLKWWQQGNPVEMNAEQLKNAGLWQQDVSSAHPAYFMLRRVNPGMNYVEEPVFKTRSQLLAQRKEAMKPDASFDLDGDGVVGVREFYFAAQMDKDCGGSLSVEEKLQGLKDMRENMGNIMFVDNAGKANDRVAGNQYRVIQQDGKIVLDQQ